MPDAATSFKFGARIVAGYLGLPVLRLARIGRGSNVHVHGSIGTDDERMHGMIATERQLSDDRFSSILWDDGVGGKCIAHNAIVDLGINRPLIHADADTTRSSRLRSLTEALNHVCFSSARLVLESHQKAPIMRFVEVVVVSRPGVDVDHSARTDHQVAGVPNALSKYCGAKTGGQPQSAVIVRARSTLRFLHVTGMFCAQPVKLTTQTEASATVTDNRRLCNRSKRIEASV